MSINQFAATATFEADPTWDDRRGLEVSPPLLDSLPQSRLMLSLGAPPPMDGGDGPLHAWKNQSVYISSKYHLDRSDEDKADSNYRFELKLGLVSDDDIDAARALHMQGAKHFALDEERVAELVDSKEKDSSDIQYRGCFNRYWNPKTEEWSAHLTTVLDLRQTKVMMIVLTDDDRPKRDKEGKLVLAPAVTDDLDTGSRVYMQLFLEGLTKHRETGQRKIRLKVISVLVAPKEMVFDEFTGEQDDFFTGLGASDSEGKIKKRKASDAVKAKPVPIKRGKPAGAAD